MESIEVDELTPPWPGMMLVAGGIVRVPACSLWKEHESFAAPCWMEARPVPVEAHRNVSAPTVAQLLWALQAGVVEATSQFEHTSSVLTVAGLDAGRDPACVELEVAGLTSIRATSPSQPAPMARQMAALDEAPRPWRQVARPCVPRHGRGEQWPPVCERYGLDPVGEPIDEPVLLDRGDMVARVHEDGEWTLISATSDDHPLGWVPTAALDEWVDEWVGQWATDPTEADEAEPPVGVAFGFAGRQWGPAAAPAPSEAAVDEPLEEVEPPPRSRRGAASADASDAPVIDAILALARAAVHRLARRDASAGLDAQHGEADLVPGRVAELLEAWADAGLSSDERLAALSATDLIVLALAAAPALDRATARSYRALAAPEPPLTIGLVVDLAGASAASRVRLNRRLARDLPLRTGEVIALAAGLVPTSTSELAVANWVLAALYGLSAPT